MSAPTPSVSAGLRSILTTLRLGQMTDTLPERLATARECSMPHVDFLEMVLADEVARREKRSAGVRAKTAHLDPSMVADAWDDTAAVTYDRAIWAELTTLRFVDDNHNALILGPVGVGKTFLATALGHIACRRRYRVHFERADKMFKRLKAARLDNSAEAELRKLISVDLLVIDDFALHPLERVEVIGSRPEAPGEITADSEADGPAPGGGQAVTKWPCGSTSRSRRLRMTCC